MFIAGGRRGKFVAGTEKERLIRFKLYPSLFFIKTDKTNFLLSSNSCTNCLSLPKTMAEYNLPGEKTLFHLHVYTLVNQILWSAIRVCELSSIIMVNRMLKL